MIADLPEPSPPDHARLLALKNQLPGMMKELRRRRQGRGVRGTPVRREPQSFCILCTAVFDLRVNFKPTPLKPGVCETCTAKLQEGFVGLVDEDSRAAFVKDTPELQSELDEAFGPCKGPRVLEVSVPQFDQIAQAHGFELVPALPPPVPPPPVPPPKNDEHQPPAPNGNAA